MTNDPKKTIRAGQRLRAWREAKGWTRKKAAKELGVTERSLENWEYGHRKPPAVAALEKMLVMPKPKKAPAGDDPRLL